MLKQQRYYKTNNNKPKEKSSSCIEWTDKVFENIYWRPLLLYKRPDAGNSAQAIRYFLLHYANGSGTVVDWQHTLNILLLGLREMRTQLYVLANEDVQKDKEQQPKPLEFNVENDVTLETLVGNGNAVNADKQSWYAWCLSQLQQEQYAILASYLGSHSLFLCKLITHSPENVQSHISEKLTRFCHRHLQLSVNEGRKTPAPSSSLFQILGLVFKRLEPFSKQIVCRLTRCRLELVENFYIQEIQDVACYNAFIQNGNGLLFWFLQACKKLCISESELLDMLTCMGEFVPVIEVLQNALPKVHCNGKADKTWQVCRLLRDKANPEWATNHGRNMLAVATFVVIAKDVTACDDAVWSQLKFKRIVHDRKTIEMAVSMGQSIKRALAYEKKHRVQTS